MEVHSLFCSTGYVSVFIMFPEPQLLAIDPFDQLLCFLFFCELRFLSSATCSLAFTKEMGCCFDKIFF